MRKFPGVAFLLFFVLTASLFPEICASSGRNAGSRWIADIDFFAEELPKRHINPFFHLPEDEFHRRVDSLKAEADSLEDYEVVVGMMKIIASIGDSHTMLNADQSGVFHRLPVHLQWFSDGLYAVETIPDYQAVLGKRLTSIEGVRVEEVKKRIKSVVSHDNPSQLKIRGPKSMVVPEILAALHIASGTDSVGFEFEELGTVTLKPTPVLAKQEWIHCLEDVRCPLPLYLQNADSNYWYRYLEEENIVYAQYRSCREHDGRPFARFAEEMFNFIDSHDPGILVFDMRLNGGGNSLIARPVIDGVKRRAAINRRGHLFVVIGRETYSSAILNALEFQNETQALFIGEPTGGKPNHYGEVRFFVLPRTWIVVTYSTKYFTCSKQDTPSLEPDIDAGLSFTEYLSCEDPVLEAIRNRE